MPASLVCSRCGSEQDDIYVEIDMLGWRCSACEALWCSALATWRGIVVGGDKRSTRHPAKPGGTPSTQGELL